MGPPLQVDVVVGFSNSGEEAYNVSAIQGSLHSAAQWNLWVQNFTLAVRLRRWIWIPGREKRMCHYSPVSPP
jgi:Translocon-associated protein (TRAP), alpha subunit